MRWARARGTPRRAEREAVMLRHAVSRLASAPAAAPVGVAASRSASTLTQILDGSVWCVSHPPKLDATRAKKKP